VLGATLLVGVAGRWLTPFVTLGAVLFVALVGLVLVMRLR
jgi:hypothetical protein